MISFRKDARTVRKENIRSKPPRNEEFVGRRLVRSTSKGGVRAIFFFADLSACNSVHHRSISKLRPFDKSAEGLHR